MDFGDYSMGKVLLCKPEDLSSNFQNSCKYVSMATHISVT